MNLGMIQRGSLLSGLGKLTFALRAIRILAISVLFVWEVACNAVVPE